MKSLLTFLLVALSLLSTTAKALEITYSKINPFDGSLSTTEGILLRGDISPGDYQYLLAVIRSDEEKFWKSSGFILASNGGDVDEALKIARLVKGTFLSAYVGESAGQCVSACFFIYAAAARREADIKTLGIHRPYVHPRRLISVSPLEAESLQKDALRRARTYLVDQDVPTGLIDRMFQQASTEIYWLSRDEIDRQLGRRVPWYEQFLIARCGLDKSLEQKYFSTGDKDIRKQLYSVDNCGTKLTAAEGRAFLLTALSAATDQKLTREKR